MIKIVNLFVLFVSVCLIFNAFLGQAQSSLNSKIKIYFNRPVNISVSTGTKAIYVPNVLADTLINYINKAKLSIDVAVYDYIQDGTFSNIANAINNAFNRGVVVRWIDNGSSTNSGISSLNSKINTLSSPPNTGNYGIMHNKFMVVDANSANSNDPIVWTGSMNWDSEQIESDVNNVVIVQDQLFAQAYTAEFEQMWGSKTNVPNNSNSRFGPYKTATTQHIFTIGGETVELYFSPSDGTNTHILSTLSSANTDLYFGVYTFTMASNADTIVIKQNQGVFIAGIMDQYSIGYSAYNILNPVLGSFLEIYTQSNSIYHNKFVIVDPSNPSSDPMVLTGSHNWSSSANTKNDENTIIIHSPTIANIYYQSFYQNFSDLGGTLPNITAVNEPLVKSSMFKLQCYPNPFNNITNINYTIREDANVKLCIYNVLGEIVSTPLATKYQKADQYSVQFDGSDLKSGIYFCKIEVTNCTSMHSKTDIMMISR